MKFRVEHSFDLDQPKYESLYFDEPFNEAMCGSLKLKRVVKKRELAGDKLTRVVVVTADRELPGALAKFLGTNKIEYTEFIDYDWGKFRGKWRTESPIMGEKLQSSGTFGFDKQGARVLRWLEGDVVVKIFGVGGVAERFIVSDVEKSYDQAAKFTQDWIKKNKLA
jgi:hypothetical protein